MNVKNVLLSCVILSSFFTVGLGGVALMLDSGGGDTAPVGIVGKKILIEFDESQRQQLVKDKKDFYDAPDFKQWMGTIVDKTLDANGKEIVSKATGKSSYEWRIWRRGAVISDELSQWKNLIAAADKKNSEMNRLTVTNGRYFWTWKLPDDGETAKALITAHIGK